MLTIPKRDISPAPPPMWRSNISKGKRAQTLNCCAHFCINEALTFPILKNSEMCGGGPGKWPSFFPPLHFHFHPVKKAGNVSPLAIFDEKSKKVRQNHPMRKAAHRLKNDKHLKIKDGRESIGFSCIFTKNTRKFFRLSGFLTFFFISLLHYPIIVNIHTRWLRVDVRKFGDSFIGIVRLPSAYAWNICKHTYWNTTDMRYIP